MGTHFESINISIEDSDDWWLWGYTWISSRSREQRCLCRNSVVAGNNDACGGALQDLDLLVGDLGVGTAT
jgi:hypothetical protein